MPRRISVTPPPIHTRIPAAKAIIERPAPGGAGPASPGSQWKGREADAHSATRSQAGYPAYHAAPLRPSGHCRRRLWRKRQRDECRRRLVAKFAVPILPPPCRQKRARNTVPPGRRRHLTMPQKALLHDPKLVDIAPVPPARHVRGRQNFDLRSERMVGRKVRLITDAEIPSDGLHRRDTSHEQRLAVHRSR